MKKTFGNALGLLSIAINYLGKSRKSSVEGGQVSDVKLEIVEDKLVTVEYVNEVRLSVLPPQPIIPGLRWNEIQFPPRKGEK